jgi:preprotein translocase subunit YajC
MSNNKTESRKQGKNSSRINVGTALILGFVIGASLILLLLYVPQQRLLQDREKAINDMARFNREEQERVRALQDVSTGEMMKWMGLTEKTNSEFENIQQHLADQESHLQNPGWFYITLMLILTAGVTAFYIWAKRTTDQKDSACLASSLTVGTV